MKVKRILIPLIAFVILGSGNMAAQTEQNKLQELELQIESKKLNEIRTISISLPDDYHKSENTYPVLYLLDGRTHFMHATSAAKFLSGIGFIPEIIVVSIHNVDRNRDFSPVFDETIPGSGGADPFLAFMEKEVMPKVKKSVRASDFSVLMGHSFGGTLAAHSLAVKPDLFDAFIAVSPYLQYKDNYVVHEAAKLYKPFSSEKYMYLTVGDEPAYFDPIEKYSGVIEQQTEGTIKYKVEKMLSENHGTIPYISVFKGLRFVFSDWQITEEAFIRGLEAIDEHTRKMAEKYGTNVQISEQMINQLGYYYMQNNEMGKAIDVLSENAERYPGSANVYDSLGEAYEGDGKFKLAEKNYQKACDRGRVLGDPNYAVYLKNLRRVQKMQE